MYLYLDSQIELKYQSVLEHQMDYRQLHSVRREGKNGGRECRKKMTFQIVTVH